MEDNLPRRTFETAFYMLSAIFMLLTLPVSIFFCVQNVPSYEYLIIWRHGRLRRAHGPGLYFILPFLDVWKRLDMRLTILEVTKLDLVTQDGIAVKVEFIVCYKIFDALNCVLKTEDVNNSIETMSRSLLEDIIAVKRFSEMVAMKDKISKDIQDILEMQAIQWGIDVQYFNVKNVRLPPMLERALFFEVTKFDHMESSPPKHDESSESEASVLTGTSLYPSYHKGI